MHDIDFMGGIWLGLFYAEMYPFVHQPSAIPIFLFFGGFKAANWFPDHPVKPAVTNLFS